MTGMLRVAVLVRRCMARGGGAERYAVALIEQLATTHEIHVFAQDIEQPDPRVHYHPLPQRGPRPRWLNQLQFAWSTWWLTRRGFDVVHSHELTWHGQVQSIHVQPVVRGLLGQATGLLRVWRALRIVLSPRRLSYWCLERARMRPGAGRCIVATSDLLAQLVQQHYPDTASMLRVVPPGVDAVQGVTDAPTRAAARVGLELRPDVTWLLFVANDFVRKGLDTLLQAMQRLAPDVHLAVVGDGAHRGTMQRRVQELGLGDRVRFLGSVGAMTRVYQAADLLVHPTREDSFGMVVVEAMAHGLPVVVSAAPYCGVAASLCHAEHAWLLSDPHQTEPLTLAVQTVLGDATCRGRLIAGGLDFARRHQWSQAAAAMADIYADAAADPCVKRA